MNAYMHMRLVTARSAAAQTRWRAIARGLPARCNAWSANVAPMPFELAHALDGLLVQLLRHPHHDLRAAD